MLPTINQMAGTEAIREELRKMPLKIGLSQFGLANHAKADGTNICYNNEALVDGNYTAIDRLKIAGLTVNLTCTACDKTFPDVEIPASFF